VGALSRDPDGPGWTVGVRTPEAQTEVRARFAEEWQAAGAPASWARMEAEAALEALLITTPSPSWSEAPR
jgi:predicted dehydrogenase